MKKNGPTPEELKLRQTKQIELTASYLNIIASGTFTIGCIAPLAAHLIGATNHDAQIHRVALSALWFISLSGAIHGLARLVLRRLKP